MFKAAKNLLFGLSAVALLVIGCFGAQALWKATHYRYDNPDSGYYQGSVAATFSGTDDDIYSFHLRGRSKPRWQWTYSTNYIYPSLQFE